MMLKTTFIPVFSSFPAKGRTSKLLSKLISNSSPHTPPTVRQNASLNVTTSQHQPPTSAYVHLPFCRKRCHYCDFPIVALGSSSSQFDPHDDPRISNYVQLLCREINATKTSFDTNPSLQTVFFGGGTPSLVPPKLVSLLLDTLESNFGITRDAEISIEMDPGTFDAEKMKGMLGVGVNRVSLGVQAFQDEILKGCGRAHGVKEVYEAIEIVGSCGVKNWSMDLISSLPHQTLQMWEDTLQLAIEANPNHVSVYDLQVEQGTKFGLLYTPGEFPLPSESQSADFYKRASSRLHNANYHHYEISSYSKEGYECKHNLTYWENKPFYAFGLGAASYLNGFRFSRPRKMKEYTNYVHNLENKVEDLVKDEKTEVDTNDLASDVVMLSLRTARGLELKPFQEAFGSSVVHSLCNGYKSYIESGHVLCLDEHKRIIQADDMSKLLLSKGEIASEVAYIRLSDPDGFLLSNELISIAFNAMST